ncbi:MAG: type II secretion system protein GspG [Verrucomicrobiota bacterium]
MKLLEVLAGLTVVGSLSATQIQNHQEVVEEAHGTMARYQLVQLGKALMMENTLGHLPSEEGFSAWLDAKTMKIEGDETGLDPWGSPIRYHVNGKRFMLVSAGEDLKYNTEDDIIFR